VKPLGAPYDIVYDLFLRSVDSSNPRCLEVMIDPVNEGLVAKPNIDNLSSLLAPITGNHSPAIFHSNERFDGRETESAWLTYNAYGTSCPMVAFIQRSPASSVRAIVDLQLSSFLVEALRVHGGMAQSSYELMGIEFGSEYDRSFRGVSHYLLTWSINRLLVSIGKRTVVIVP